MVGATAVDHCCTRQDGQQLGDEVDSNGALGNSVAMIVPQLNGEQLATSPS